LTAPHHPTTPSHTRYHTHLPTLLTTHTHRILPTTHAFPTPHFPPPGPTHPTTHTHTPCPHRHCFLHTPHTAPPCLPLLPHTPPIPHTAHSFLPSRLALFRGPPGILCGYKAFRLAAPSSTLLYRPHFVCALSPATPILHPGADDSANCMRAPAHTRTAPFRRLPHTRPIYSGSCNGHGLNEQLRMAT